MPLVFFCMRMFCQKKRKLLFVVVVVVLGGGYRVDDAVVLFKLAFLKAKGYFEKSLHRC